MYSKSLTILEIVSFVMLATCSLPAGSKKCKHSATEGAHFLPKRGRDNSDHL